MRYPQDPEFQMEYNLGKAHQVAPNRLRAGPHGAGARFLLLHRFLTGKWPEGNLTHSRPILVFYCLSGAPDFPPPTAPVTAQGGGEKAHAAPHWEVLAKPSRQEDKGQNLLLLEEPTSQIWSSHVKYLHSLGGTKGQNWVLRQRE